MDEQNENPVANGLVALVAVAVVVGLLAAIIALLGTRLFGLTGASGSVSDGVVVGDSLYLPSLEPTELDSGLLVTLSPVETEEPETPAETLGTSGFPTERESARTSATASATADPKGATILLSGGASSVESGDELMLSGTYSRGEGSVLSIWYNVDGAGWKEFNQDVNVYGGVFQVFVTTYTPGRIQWRVEDPNSGLTSNEISVTHGE